MLTSDKIYTKESFLSVLSQWQKEGKKIVFTNGCFDILHLGHVDYLEKAKQLGDKLIVGLNTDNSVKRLKGETRPVTDQHGRGRVIAALQFVDAVIFFDEDTPFDLISFVKPDILVKGDDYTVDNIVGADVVIKNGGAVKTISLVKGYSTTDIISKIKKLN
ncbi:MAG: D-glycero-beta-D-manno-heptose 1-phosphate adenylyltransferase [Cytophagaceae bacterium]|nr:D-glycero-beta-D-manno-heptose 1-phosphate adenylyltransferase [Cytophagaceae bacterium]